MNMINGFFNCPSVFFSLSQPGVSQLDCPNLDKDFDNNTHLVEMIRLIAIDAM